VSDQQEICILDDYPDSDVEELCVGVHLPTNDCQASSSSYHPDQEIITLKKRYRKEMQNPTKATTEGVKLFVFHVSCFSTLAFSTVAFHVINMTTVYLIKLT
jgi:hypothetical protein